jgi:ribose transport system permease protein
VTPTATEHRGPAVAQAARRRGPAASRIRNIAPLIALVMVTALFASLNGKFLTLSNIHSLAAQGAILMVLATGATFVILLGSIDLSVEGVMGMSSMVVSLLIANTRNHIDLGFGAVVIALAVGALTGVINGLGLTLARIPSFMFTLGTWYVALGVATVLFGGNTATITSRALLDLGAPWLGGFPPTVFIALAIAVAGWATLKYTRAGRHIRAIGSAEEVVALSGVPVHRYKVLAFGIAGTASALAGVMASAQVGNGSVDIGSGMVFTTIAAVVVGGTLLSGGKGGVLNTVVGVLLLTVLSDGMVLAGISTNIQESVQGVIVVAAVAAAAWPQRSRLRIAK